MGIKILTDSCSDLGLEYLEAHEEILSFIGMPITIGDRHFRDDLGKKQSLELFYSELSSGLNASTAQITPNELYEDFKAACSDGDSVIYIGLSSGLSGTYNNALMAKQILEDDGIVGMVHVIDGMAASIGQGLMVMKVVEAIEKGETVESIVAWLNKHKYCFHHWFVVDDLHYLKRGGRIPPVLATVGTALNVKPILTIDEAGCLVKHTNVRGRKKALRYLIEKVKVSKIIEGTVYIGHGNCYDEAEFLKEKVLELAPEVDVVISNLSSTIACHVGPNMIAIAFVAESRI